MTQAITTHLTSCLRSVDCKFGTTAMNSCETFSLSSMFQGCPHVTLVEQGCPSVPQQLELNGSSLSICVGQSERNGPQLGQQHNKNMWFSFPGQAQILTASDIPSTAILTKTKYTTKNKWGRLLRKRQSFSAIHGKRAELTYFTN